MADIRTSGLYNRVSFTVVTSAGGSKTATLSTVFGAGVYTIQSIAGDTDLEIYLGAEDGTSVGSSAAGAKAIVASGDFKYVTTVNANTSDAIIFTLYQLASDATTLATKTDAFWAPPVITDITPSSLYNQNATTVITGSNFASNAGVQFRKSDDATLVSAKSVTRTSATSITATRPDSFSTTDAPYDVVVTNATTGLSSISLNAVTAGSAPSWVTSTALPAFQKTVAYSQAVSATDADASPTVTYSVNSSTLPAGITFSAGTFSGTPTENSGSYSASIRATDLGGNFVDRTFTLAQAKPDAPTIGTATQTGATTATVPFTAPSYTGTSVITTYTATSSPGSLTTTLSQAGSGTINFTGLTESTSYTFTVTATNSSGISLASSASNQITTPAAALVADIVIIGAGGGGGGDGGGGGGAGAVVYYASSNLSLSTSYPILVGAGGNSYSIARGNDSSFSNFTTALGGGGGRTQNSTTAYMSGGSSGGAGGYYALSSVASSQTLGTATAIYGNAGGGNTSNSYLGGAGGGGAGSAGNATTGNGGSSGGNGISNFSAWSTVTGTGNSGYYAGGGGGGNGSGISGAAGGLGGGGQGGGPNGSANDGLGRGNGVANTGSGGGGGNGNPSIPGLGASGIVMVRYASATQRASGGTITTDGTYYYHTFLSSGSLYTGLTAKAIGGQGISLNNGYYYHTFTGTSTFTPTQSLTAEVMIIAGGGGGGTAGGGAGGFRVLTSQSMNSSTAYTATIGAGAPTYGYGGGSIKNGSSSTLSGSGFSTISATGGGGGVAYEAGETGGSGGSGGGGRQSSGAGSGNAGGYNPSEGNSGGSGSGWTGSGGGGASSSGTSGASTVAGNGGSGTSAYSSWGLATTTGQNISETVYYAGGGGGGGNTPGSAGAGGGGTGDVSWPNSFGKPNTGGGGGGSWAVGGGFGGSGLIIIRYPA